MSERIDATLMNRLERAERDLAHEFGAIDRDVVKQHVAHVSDDLLRGATVTDFVPVLTQRRVREILRSAPV